MFFISHSYRNSSLTMVLGVAFAVSNTFADVKYDIRAKTGDKVTATLYKGGVGYVSGQARQGSFGAPSINDKGNIAYACILSGVGISAFSNNTVVARAKGKAIPKLAIQAGRTVRDNFMPGFKYPSYGAPGSARMYRISRNVQINNSGKIGFAGQVLFLKATDQLDKGVVTKTTYESVDTASYGALLPSGATFRNYGLAAFSSYYAEILKEPITLNSLGSTVYNADFYVTDTKTVAGFAFSSATNGGVIATVETPAIGLPYFAQFSAFSEPVIADSNRAFVVADLNDDGAAYDGIWQGNNPNLQPIVVKGGKVGDGSLFVSFDGVSGPSRNGKLCAFIANSTTGRAAFRANVDGTALVKVATVGGKAPGLPGKGTAGTFSTLDLVASNNAGQVAVLGSVPGKTGNQLSGIWLSDNSGTNLTGVVLEGQTIKVGNVEKTINKLAFSPICGINRKGQLVFTASFTDRTSAVIVSSL